MLNDVIRKNIYDNIKRCTLLDNGNVNYYLSSSDSTLKESGSAAVLDGTDGQVMVEIPKFYTKRVKEGTITTWSITHLPTSGYTLHPAFIKEGVEVDHRYVGAYDACYWEASSGTYKSGLNLDALSVDLVNDKLASVSGVYPIVGVSRSDTRSLASNRGAGWHQLDFWLVQAIQILYLVEMQTFYSQRELGDGNTNGGYLASSAVQSDSPHTIAGASNAWGNSSTDGTQPSAGAKPGTAYMSYRGIENIFGNTWNWVDGFNINDRQAYVFNSPSTFADSTSTGYDILGAPMPASNGYVADHQDIDNALLPNSVGAGSTTGWTDYYYQSTGWCVARFGGTASSGSQAGLFAWYLSNSSGFRYRIISARLAF